MAQLKRAQYVALIDNGTDEGVEHTVTVIHGDMIRGEQTARGRKVPGLESAPVEHASIWVWHAMKRTGLTEKPYGEWIDDVLDVQPIGDPDDPQTAAVPVDPTAASTS